MANTPSFMICFCERSCQMGKGFLGREKVGLLYRVSFNNFFYHMLAHSRFFLVHSPALHAVVLRCMLQCDAMRCKILTYVHWPCPLASHTMVPLTSFFFRTTSDDVCPKSRTCMYSTRTTSIPVPRLEVHTLALLLRRMR